MDMTMVFETITEEQRIEEFKTKMPPFVVQEMLTWLQEHGFFRQVASTKYHGAYEGGLFDHSFSVMMNLKKLTGRLDLEWQRESSPYIIGMFHDLCKIDQYVKVSDGNFKWVRTQLGGHGSKSVIMLKNMIDITEEEEACIRYHMGAFSDKEEWTLYTDAIHKFPNVLWTHTADMMASHIEMR